MRRLTVVALSLVLSAAGEANAQTATRPRERRVRVVAKVDGNRITVAWTPGKQAGKPGTSGNDSPGTGALRTIPKKTPRKPRPFVHRETCINTGGGTDAGSFWGCTNGNLRQTGCATMTVGECRPGDTIPPNSTPRRKPAPDLTKLVPPALEQVPLPEPMLSPPLEEPGTMNLVGLPTFFAATNYRADTVTTTDGEYFLALTWTPRVLTFDPADGKAPARCSGPGKRIRSKAQADTAKSQRCWHLYTDVPPNNRDNYDTRLSITWDLTYVTDVPLPLIGGAIPPTLTTTTDIPVTIEQRQAVLVNPN
jgi:hypothetical protein